MEWERWNRKAIDFMNRHEKLNLNCIFEEYQGIINESYSLFNELVLSTYAQEINEYKIMDRVRELDQEMKDDVYAESHGQVTKFLLWRIAILELRMNRLEEITK